MSSAPGDNSSCLGESPLPFLDDNSNEDEGYGVVLVACGHVGTSNVTLVATSSALGERGGLRLVDSLVIVDGRRLVFWTDYC